MLVADESAYGRLEFVRDALGHRDGGEATRRYIARGDISREWQFVEKGLAAGERVVAEGGHKVRPGMKVEGVPSDKSK